MSMKELGLRCPECGQTDRLDVACTVWATVDDDGTDHDGDTEWGEDSKCYCPKCNWAGTVKEAEICVGCEGKGYVNVFNKSKQREEVQRCDTCQRYDTDKAARQAQAQDNPDGERHADPPGG